MADCRVYGSPDDCEPSVEPVPFIDLVAQYQTIKPQVQEAVDSVLESQTFVLGEQVEILEQKIADYCDSRFAIGCASGTDALILSLMALDIGPGDEVITTPFTFFATASSIYRTGARPVFVDIDPRTYNLDPEQVERAITERTKAIMPVHLFGQCADMEPIWRMAVRSGISVIEDACQAIGAEYRGRRAGVLGTVGCFSFFPTKNLGGAGDGGIITTDDPELAKRLKRLRVHGDVGQYQHVEVGLNSRLDTLQAAILSVKMDHIDAWSDGRARNAARYCNLLESHGLLEQLDLPLADPDHRHVYNQFTIRVRNGHRDELLKRLREQQIGCAIYYPIPLHQQQCFRSLGYSEGDFPVAEQAAREVLALPIFTELTERQQDRVVDGIVSSLAAISGASHSGDSTIPFRRAA